MTLLCGPANSGKVRAVIERVLGDCERGPGAWLLVPTAADARRARAELVGRAPTVIGVRVGTFHHLVHELGGGETADPGLAGAVAGGDATDLDPAVAALVARRFAVRAGFDEGMLEYPGAARGIASRLAELRSAGVVDRSGLAARLAELVPAERRAWGRLLGAYDELIDAGVVRDAAWYEQRALRTLAGAGPMHGVVPVHAYGFDDLTEAQVAVLVALGRRVDVTLSLPFVPGRLVFARRQALVDRLTAAGAVVVDSGDADFRSPVLAALEQRLYEPTAEPVFVQFDDVRFVECSGELQQAEAVVHEVGELLGSGVSAGEIACLTAVPARSRVVLEAAFRRAGVPVTFELPRRVRDVPAGRAVLDLLDAVSQGDDGRFAAFARSRLATGLDRDQLDRWELRSRRHVPAAGDAWHLQRWVPRNLRELRGRDTSIDALRLALTELVPASAGDVRMLAAIGSLLDRIEALCPGVGGPPRLHELRTAIAAMPIPAPDERPDGAVVVAPITRVRTDRFEAVVVYDLHSGGFAGGRGDAGEAPLVARELAYIACTRAWRRLCFVRQATGSDGRLRAAHPAWLELRRLLPHAQLRRRGNDDVVLVPSQSVLVPELRLALASELRVVPAVRDTDAGDIAAGDTSAGPLRLRVTDVETYAQCPSRWFVQRHLLPRDPAGPTRRQLVGTLVHETLARLVPQLSTDGDISNHQLDEMVGVILHEAAGSMFPAPGPVEVARARVLVRRFARAEQPASSRTITEVAFGDGDEASLPALELYGALLSGRIDRVDVDDAGNAVVHDYKLSRSAVAAAKLVAEGRLQLPLYWMALAEGGMRPVGAVYRPLEADRPRGMLDDARAPALAGEFRTDRLDGDAIDGLLGQARDAAHAAIEGIGAGQVGPAPIGGSCPSWCDLQSICRVEAR